MKSKWAALIIFLGAAIVVGLFQNCGQVKLKTSIQDNSLEPAASTIPTINFCSSRTTPQLGGRSFSMTQAFVVNLNARVNLETGKFEIDSDADGLSDLQEENLAANSFSYNKQNRRTFGVIDGICYLLGNNDSGACLSPQFGDSNLPPGLLLSDVNALGLSGSSAGLDTVGDFIPDFVKIIFAIDPGRPLLAMGNDYDGDGIKDFEELRSGRSPVSSMDANVEDKFLLKYSVAQASSSECETGQQAYQIEIEQLPLFIPTLSFEPGSGNDESFIHTANENVFGVYFISETSDGQVPQVKQLWGAVFRSGGNGAVPVSLNPSQFKLYGLW